MTPKAVNGAKMFPLGRIPVTFRLGGTEYHDDLHIYPENQGTILSWKACKALHILPPDYPNPIQPAKVCKIKAPTSSNATLFTLQEAMSEYATIFDGRIWSMEGEQFQIS